MGAWSEENFGNDDAADWVYDLESSKGTDTLLSPINTILSSQSYLESHKCSEALAASEVIAASITGDADVTALGGVIYNGTAFIDGEAILACYPNAIWSGDGAVTSNAAVSAIGYIYGEEWADVTEESNVWSIVSANSNTWTNVPAGTNTWLRQN